MRVLLLSAYDANSHRRWREGLVAAFELVIDPNAARIVGGIGSTQVHDDAPWSAGEYSQKINVALG